MSGKVLIVKEGSGKDIEDCLRERMHKVDVVRKAEDALVMVRNDDYDLVIQNMNQPHYYHIPPLKCLHQIKKEKPKIKTIILIHKDDKTLCYEVDTFIRKPIIKEHLINIIEKIIGIPKFKSFVEYQKDDLRINEQINMIGENTLMHILVQLYSNIKQVKLEYLSPGFSGSIVLSGRVVTQEPPDYFVLKISRDESSIKKELENLKIIRRSGMAGRLAPDLRGNKIAWSNGWYAIAYEHIGAGGESEKVKNFKKFYRENGNDIEIKLDNIFTRLYTYWYKPEENNHEDKSGYRLWQDCYNYDEKTKSKILSRLDVLKPYFINVYKSPEAENHLQTVRTFIEHETIENISINGFQCNTMLCQVHGDLNSRNILFITDEPIFIDFATYKPCNLPEDDYNDSDKMQGGHVLDDYAKMEAEIKFVLMDSENYKDIDIARLPTWVEAENKLLEMEFSYNSDSDMENKLGIIKEESVKKACRLICIIRKMSQDAYSKSKDQYLIALLHHTLKYLLEPEVTDAKQLYVVYSAATICGKVSEFLK